MRCGGEPGIDPGGNPRVASEDVVEENLLGEEGIGGAEAENEAQQLRPAHGRESAGIRLGGGVEHQQHGSRHQILALIGMLEKHQHQQEQGDDEPAAQRPGPPVGLEFWRAPPPDREGDDRAEYGQRGIVLQGERPPQGLQPDGQRREKSFARPGRAVASGMFDERQHPAPRSSAVAREQRGRHDKRHDGQTHERDEAPPRRRRHRRRSRHGELSQHKQRDRPGGDETQQRRPEQAFAPGTPLRAAAAEQAEQGSGKIENEKGRFRGKREPVNQRLVIEGGQQDE